MYLIDNNVLSHLSSAQRTSKFFTNKCRLPTDVVYEAGGNAKIENFKEVEYRTTASVLGFLRKVMATVPEDDTAIINLYSNKGAADPMLIACALDAMQEQESLLFGAAWIVVSNDKAVRAKAAELGITCSTREEFMARVEPNWLG